MLAKRWNKSKGTKVKKWLSFLLIVALIEAKQAHLKGWYPTSKKALQEKLKEFDQQAQKDSSFEVQGARALIVPHAGYSYSGHIAALTFATVKKQSFDRIILLAPSHRIFFHGIALLNDNSYHIAIGTVALDKPVIEALQKKEIFTLGEKLQPRDPFDVEHALEIELPFLQYYFPKVKVVPLIVGNLSELQAKECAEILKDYSDQKTLIVVSSDFTHYGKDYNYIPFKDSIKERIKNLDNRILQTIFEPSLSAFTQIIKETDATVCGKFPLMILLALLEKKALGNVAAHLIRYETSADNQETFSRSVSYSGIVFGHKHDGLNQQEQDSLLQLARDAIQNGFTKKHEEDLLYPLVTPALKSTKGVFVTLYDSKKQLRGCIGSITSSKPLYKTIYKRAQDAAFKDKRFSALQEKELATVHIKISVLTEPRKIKNYEEIKKGVHGFILKKGTKKAVFLPSVPVEQGWDIPTALEHLSEKAGLEKDAWKQGAQLKVFETIDFEEK